MYYYDYFHSDYHVYAIEWRFFLPHHSAESTETAPPMCGATRLEIASAYLLDR